MGSGSGAEAQGVLGNVGNYFPKSVGSDRLLLAGLGFAALHKGGTLKNSKGSYGTEPRKVTFAALWLLPPHPLF